ncbi:molybdopterin molybdotransferase MoeA [Leptolyngbya sp. FACHB-321]|uniref:molybdopterin molybdotransferase MoeA n=1 Tax=Leptolyngbya sp. FACHB-321 TaxID=2692807 RepID=UPI0016822110|nr:gephyrin-like molybdotransferase Glp [Leptolyngbya sp. FACHB-321]MBD2038957.1 molybdopterin molybdotransferase MoeA [Leptolyngbya sp. FACHB-321]
MIPVEQAETIILSLVQPLDVERDSEMLPLLEARGRILAGSVTSDLDFPHWDNSAMDGYAVRYADVQACSAESPVTLAVIETIPAGYQPQCVVEAGQAARILTGSVMPAGADTIVIQEETQRDGDQVTILAAPQPQAFVRKRAAFYQSGQPLLSSGLRLQAPEMAVLAAAQCAQVKVYRQPRVTILSTGDELVSIDQPLQSGEIVDSNQYALASLITQAGAIPIRLGVVRDEPEALKQAIAIALDQSDIVLSSGGVSVGDYDYVEDILAELGGNIHIRAVAVKPGKPLTVATFEQKAEGRGQEAEGRGQRAEGRGQEAEKARALESADSRFPLSKAATLYFGLPGNPVSALVTFCRFVEPALRKLSGLPERAWKPTFVRAKTQVDLRSNGKRESYLWGHLDLADGLYEFALAGGSHSSGNLINLAGTNGLAVVPIGKTHISSGESIYVMQIGRSLQS